MVVWGERTEERRRRIDYGSSARSTRSGASQTGPSTFEGPFLLSYRKCRRRRPESDFLHLRDENESESPPSSLALDARPFVLPTSRLHSRKTDLSNFAFAGVLKGLRDSYRCRTSSSQSQATPLLRSLLPSFPSLQVDRLRKMQSTPHSSGRLRKRPRHDRSSLQVYDLLSRRVQELGDLRKKNNQRKRERMGGQFER